MKAKVTLGIGNATRKKEDVIDIDESEYALCKTDEERQKLLDEYYEDWANNYIVGSINLIKGAE